MKRIAIFGAGISGLTVAHELSKLPGYQIQIFEKNNKIGGLARSDRDQNECATELSWRVYFDFYENLFKIMKEIPLIENSNKNVLNNLSPYRHTSISDTPLTNKDKVLGMYNIFYGFTSCDKRLDELDNLTWWNSLDNTSKSNVFREIGQWLGMDRYKGSYKSVIKVGMEMQMLSMILSRGSNWVVSKPTSEAWFDHWQNLLQNNGVSFHLGTELVSVRVQDNKIISAVVYNRENNTVSTIYADYFVLAVPIESLDKIIDKSPQLNDGTLVNVKTLANTSLHLQLSFQVYFDRSVSLGHDSNGENNGFLIVDSPWDIIVLQYDKLFKDTSLCTNIPNAKGGWSIAACTAYVPGIVYGKPFNKCSNEEIITELWAQLLASKLLRKKIIDNNGFDLTDIKIIKWSPMWSTYQYDDQSGYLLTSEPKFTNTAGSWAIRPSFKTHIDNLFISTAYVKETIDIYSMEGAAIAGKFVANEISKQTDKPIIKARPIMFAPFRAFDNVSYNLGLPNIGPGLLIIFILIIILVIVYLVGKVIVH